MEIKKNIVTHHEHIKELMESTSKTGELISKSIANMFKPIEIPKISTGIPIISVFNTISELERKEEAKRIDKQIENEKKFRAKINELSELSVLNNVEIQKQALIKAQEELKSRKKKAKIAGNKAPKGKLTDKSTLSERAEAIELFVRYLKKECDKHDESSEKKIKFDKSHIQCSAVNFTVAMTKWANKQNDLKIKNLWKKELSNRTREEAWKKAVELKICGIGKGAKESTHFLNLLRRLKLYKTDI